MVLFSPTLPGRILCVLLALVTLGATSARADSIQLQTVQIAQRPTHGVDVIWILRQVTHLATGIDRDLILHQVARAYATAGDVRAAREAAALINDGALKSATDSAIAQEQAKAGDPQAALQTIQAIKTDHGKALVHRELAMAEARKGNPTQAVQYAEQQLRGVTLAAALADIAILQARAGNIKDALETAGRISSLGYSKTAKAMALNEITTAQAKASDQVGAQKTLDQAIRTAAALPKSDIKGGSPQAAVLQRIALTQLELGDAPAAFRAVNAIERAYFKVEALLALAKAHLKLSDRGAADTMMQRALQVATNITERDWQSMALEHIAKAQAETGDTLAARQTVTLIRNIYAKIIALYAIAAADAEAGNTAAARTALQQALQITHGMDDNDDRKSRAFGLIAKGYAKMRGFDAALQTAALIKSEPHRASTMAGILVEKAITPKETTDSEATLQEVPKNASGVICAKVVTLARAGDLRKALQLASTITDDFYKAHAMYRIAIVQTKTGDIQGILDWALKEKSAIVKARALLGLAESVLGIEPATFLVCVPE